MTISKLPPLDIIILNYNTASLTSQLVNNLTPNQPSNWTITIIDNASSSTDQTKLHRLKKLYPHLNLVFLPKNLGFAKANNIALRSTQSPYILLLNSDIITNIPTIQKTLRFLLTKPKAAVVTPKLFLNTQRTQLDWACHRGFPTPWAALTYFLKLETLFPFIPLFSQYHQRYKNLNIPHQVDAISGAFFLAKRADLVQVGFFDEDYFMYGEDIDLCYKLKKSGKQIWFYPHAYAIHLKHQAGLKNSSSSTKHLTRSYFFQAMKIFYIKHYASLYPSWFNKLVLTGIDLLQTSPFKK